MNVQVLAMYLKAIIAFLTALAAALTATSATDGLSGGEFLVSLLGAVVTGLGTYAVPNRAPVAPDQ